MARVAEIGIEGCANEASPVLFWDFFGQVAIRCGPVSEIGPSLLGRILGLNDIQEGTLEISFKMAETKTSCCSISTISGSFSGLLPRGGRRS